MLPPPPHNLILFQLDFDRKNIRDRNEIPGIKLDNADDGRWRTTWSLSLGHAGLLSRGGPKSKIISTISRFLFINKTRTSTALINRNLNDLNQTIVI